MSPGTAPSLERLAAEVGRPVTALGAFDHLTPEQVELLSAAVAGARERRRRDIQAGLDSTLPPVLRPVVLRLLRGAWR